MTASAFLRCVVLVAAVLACHFNTLADESTATDNIALGKPYTLQPAPRYSYCTDPGDRTQLTDGKQSEGYFWTARTTVGWSSTGYAAVTIDLGMTEPIAGVTLRTAAGTAGVHWPTAVRIHVSDDGKVYRDVGDLVMLSAVEHGTLPEAGYAVRRLATRKLVCHGRFVRLVIFAAGPYVFADEIEVYRGQAAWLLNSPEGTVVATDPETYFEQSQVTSSIARRFAADRQQIAAAISRLATNGNTKLAKHLSAELQSAASQCRASQFDRTAFETRIPFNAAHARLFAIQGTIWHAEGAERLVAWKANPWDPSKLVRTIPRETNAEPLVVHTMRGEYRSAAVNVAFSGDHRASLRCYVEGLPGGPTPKCVTLHQAAWTDTREGRPVASALEARQPATHGWQVSILPGVPTQLWLTFHVLELEPREYAATFVLEMDGKTIRIPLHLHVYPLQFPRRTTLLLGGWSYTNSNSYGLTLANRLALIAHLKQHFVNAPWAAGNALSNYQFAADGTITLNTKNLDDWLATWPKARRYQVFVHVPTTLGNAKLGTSKFEKNVATWIHAWVAHLAEKGIKANQLALLLRDEPNENKDVTPIVAWSRALRAAEPEVIIWEDPTYQDPAKAPAPFWEACDVLCPNRVMWIAGEPVFEKFYLAQQAKGATLQFYSCSGPARLLDPYSYYRAQAWHAWKVGATGSFFWAFGDNGGASSWNEYANKRSGYAPMFLDAKTVTPAKQMEAIRESVEDYEYLVMLSAAIEHARQQQIPAHRIKEAQDTLHAAVQRVLAAPGMEAIEWHTPKDRSGADKARVAILEQLTKLKHP